MIVQLNMVDEGSKRGRDAFLMLLNAFRSEVYDWHQTNWDGRSEGELTTAMQMTQARGKSPTHTRVNPAYSPDRQTGQFTLGHRPGLDGLRGVAILFVLGTHTAYLWPGITWRLRGGYIGVDIFFVLSGFLITSLLVEEFDRRNHISLQSFYLRRACRLLPALFLMLTAAFIFSQLASAAAATTSLKHELLGNASIVLYVGNWYQIYRPSAWGVGQTWSLGIEEQFYLVWPLVLIVLLKFGRRGLMLGFIGAAVAVSTVLCAWAYHQSPTRLTAFLATDCRLSGIMIGAGIAVLLHRGWRPGRWVVPVACLASIFLTVELNLIGPNFTIPQWQYDGGFTVIAVAAGLVILAAIDTPSRYGRAIAVRPLRFFGRISYSLYLWHYPILFATLALLPAPGDGALRIAIAWPLSIVVATLSYVFVERPIVSFGHRFSSEIRPARQDA